ncbi:MAG TPA: glycosyltransferase family 4 protein [Ktedonobacteraceae bacterium]
MRIAHIAPSWLPVPPKSYGGTEYVIYNLIEEQITQGHHVTLFAPKDARTSARLISFFPRSLVESDVPWNAHLKAFYHLFKSVDYLKSYAQEFDILHLHLSLASDMYLFPLLENLPLPVITTLHSQFPFDRFENGQSGDADHFYMEWLSTTPMVAISKSARDQELNKFPLNFVAIIHHGINLQEFPPPTSRPEDFFVWLGRCVPEKGALQAIEACKQVGARLILAGIVDDHIPEAQEYFHDEIEPHLDGKQIRYIGPVDRKERNDLLDRARGLLNPLQWEEPFGMVMIEAMATGCPVIAFRRGSAPEIITNDQIGFLVDNVEEMVKQMASISTIDRRAIRQHVETHFSAAAMTKNYLRVYQDICKI